MSNLAQLPNINTGKERLYRYRERTTVSIYGGDRRTSVVLDEYEIIRKTKCGAWIESTYGQERFVDTRSTVRKKFACVTKEDALTSYIARKNAQIRILESRLQTAVSGRDMAATMTKETL